MHKEHQYAFMSNGQRLPSNHDMRLEQARTGLWCTERKLAAYAKKNILAFSKPIKKSFAVSISCPV